MPDDRNLSSFRLHLARLVLEAAVSAVRGEDVARLNADLAARWAQRMVAVRNGRGAGK